MLFFVLSFAFECIDRKWGEIGFFLLCVLCGFAYLAVKKENLTAKSQSTIHAVSSTLHLFKRLRHCLGQNFAA